MDLGVKLLHQFRRRYGITPTQGALCRSVETFTGSLVKGMAIVSPGVLGVEGGERTLIIFW